MEDIRHFEHDENLQHKENKPLLTNKPTPKLLASTGTLSSKHIGREEIAQSKDSHVLIENLPSTSSALEVDDKEPVENYNNDEAVDVSVQKNKSSEIVAANISLASEINQHLEIPSTVTSNAKDDHEQKDPPPLTNTQVPANSEDESEHGQTDDAREQEGLYLEAESDESEDVPQTSHEAKHGATLALAKEGIFKDASDNIHYILPNPVAAKLLNPFMLRPHISNPQISFPPLPHIGNPQRPVLMLPHLPRPFLMLPHQMAHARWPFLPLPRVSQDFSETGFVRFSALNAAGCNQMDAIIQEQSTHGGNREEKKHLKKKMKLKAKEGDLEPVGEDTASVKYKNKYRKTNRASTMLICDKVKLPLKKEPREIPNLVDVSEEMIGECSTSTGIGPIVEYVVRKKLQENDPLNLMTKSAKNRKSGKPKCVLNDTKEKQKGTRGKKFKSLRKVKVETQKKGKVETKRGVQGKKVRKLNGLTPRKVEGKKSKKIKSHKRKNIEQISESQRLEMKKVLMQVMPPRPKPKKEAPLLSAEKILYNKLTEVVKQIAEPNIFSPMTPPPKSEIRCSTCEVTYPDRKSLWDHIQNHLRKPVPFRLSKYYRFCKVCRKYVSEIRDHIRAVHFDGGTPYECLICHERFRYKGLLRNHAQNRHTTARNYMCEMCGLAFKQSVTLRKHMLVHSDLKNFFCSTCEKAFKTMYALQKHTVVHALVKPYKCEICNKEFTQQTNMKSHQRTHTGEKPYKCDLCTMAFTHNVSLKTHKKKHHGIDMWNPSKKQSSQSTDQPASQPVIEPASHLFFKPTNIPSNQLLSDVNMVQGEDHVESTCQPIDQIPANQLTDYQPIKQQLNQSITQPKGEPCWQPTDKLAADQLTNSQPIELQLNQSNSQPKEEPAWQPIDQLPADQAKNTVKYSIN